ncbi:MAG: hypothetical protein U9R38_00820 [Candidatus Margulisiibacteriota bacterium]|nr:hypothetical protein [Candidatus Margulisiibacteriota bacterium]
MIFGFNSAIAQDSSLSVTTTGGTDTDTATKLVSNIGGLSLGYLKVGTDEVANLAWHPDFKLGPWGLGFDVNITLSEVRPPEYENFVMRYVEYDDGKKGLRYGTIQNLTWGHGLLMKDYSTVATGPILLNNEQLAFKGYVDMDQYVVRGLKTGSGIYGARVEERVHPMLTLGQTYLNDSDGVTLAGTTEIQKVSAYGVDATVPLPWGFEGYAEYAHLVDHGSGFSSGIGWDQDFFIAQANFLAEYRFLDSNFVPGYFDSDYEVNPVSLSSAEVSGNVKNGYLAQAGLKVMDMAYLKLVYENYNESDAGVEGELFAKLPQDIEVTGYYKQPSFTDFRSLSLEEGAIIGGSAAYPVNPFTKVVVHYKKVYNPSTQQIEESQYYELRLSL